MVPNVLHLSALNAAPFTVVLVHHLSNINNFFRTTYNQPNPAYFAYDQTTLQGKHTHTHTSPRGANSLPERFKLIIIHQPSRFQSIPSVLRTVDQVGWVPILGRIPHSCCSTRVRDLRNLVPCSPRARLPPPPPRGYSRVCNFTCWFAMNSRESL